jgi:hypothetical protein
MNQTLLSFIEQASPVQKALFLMVCGVVSVFIVQLVFYITIKVWPKAKKE